MWVPPIFLDTDVVTRVALVEGYNTNTYQAQDDPNVPLIRRHPSAFTGVDAGLELRLLGRDTDRTTFNFGARANHYEPLTTQYQSDDGALNASLASRVTIGPRTTLAVSDGAALTSFNAAHVTDGTIFAFDPTQVRSTYWLDDFGAALTHQLSPNWRLTQSLGLTVSGTLQSAPTQLADGGPLIEHRGLDYVMPYVETDVNRDLTPRAAVDLMVLYQYAWEVFVLDYTQSPPRNIGPDKQAFLTSLAGWTYHETQELSTVLRAGGVLASAPPRDIDQRAVLSPAGMAELYYVRPFFDLVAAAGYTWGTINPRLGAGPTANASLLAIGIPHHVGAWANFALVGRAQASYSSLITGVGQSTGLGLCAAGGEVRYGVSRWLGALAGFDFRYATFDTPGQFNPPFLQYVFFLGFSGYFSSDRTQLPLTTFTAPVQPPA
ncbi:MAG: hypothetical protein WBY94_26570 [Polyangiaceae bacterium]